MRPALRGLTGLVRLAVAAVALGAAAYVLSWRILYDGPAGSDGGFHLNLAGWVSAGFPWLGWWDPWDDHGIPYRLGYPLAAHWVAVLAGRLDHVPVGQGMQLVQFAITPLCAIGIYAFCAWRLRSPLAGLVAGFLYLLSPLTWTTLLDGGIYANQAGTVLLMPAMVALDACFEEWAAGRRGCAFRLSLGATAGLMALMGFVSPFQLGASTAAVLAYALAVRPGAGTRWRWLLVMAPTVLLLTLLLTVFWSLPEQRYLAFVASHTVPRAYDPDLFQTWAPQHLFALRPFDPHQGYGRNSLSPAVTLPALLGALTAVRDRKARVLVALVAYGLLTMLSHALSAITWGLPVLPYLVHARGGLTLVQLLVPVLAGIGLVRLPAALGAAAGARLWPRWRVPTGLAALAVAGGLAAGSTGVVTFSHWVQGGPDMLAYGDYQPSVNDLWERTPPGETPPSRSVWSQLADPRARRPPLVGCFLTHCRQEAVLRARQAATLRGPPQRGVLDAWVAPLLMDFHDLTGGAQAYSYNFQLPSTPELDNWLLDSMLVRPGTTTKEQLAQVTGADAVVLGRTQTGRAADYERMGWERVGDVPVTYRSPHPAGLAAQWPAGAAVLVIGHDQQSASHPYNDVFEAATNGMIPYQEGWLVRGGSPYVDDHPLDELRQYRALLLIGYQYHDRDAAWNLLDAYVRAGGGLYVETGWQFVDPDWDATAAPAPLPVSRLGWRTLSAGSTTAVDGAAQPGWGPYRYGSAGWGASVAASTRRGAESVVAVGGQVVAARWRVGGGRVFWSGGGLLAHATGDGSAAEAAYLAEQWRWLLQPAAAPDERAVAWSGTDRLTVGLDAAPGPTWVLVKESMVPGWSAELVTPSGVRPVEIRSGEMDFVLVHLSSVPPGSRLVLTYGPTATIGIAWAVSLASLAGLLSWIAFPSWPATAVRSTTLRLRALE